MRVINPSTVCLRLETGAIVQAELTKPLSPSSHLRSQSVNVLKPVPAMVQLGSFDMENGKFVGSLLEVDLPDVKYERVNYMTRKNSSE